MALDEARLKGTLKQAYNDVAWNELEAADALDLFCGKLAKVIVDEVKQLKINYSGGLTAPNGAVGGSINHTVS